MANEDLLLRQMQSSERIEAVERQAQKLRCGKILLAHTLGYLGKITGERE